MKKRRRKGRKHRWNNVWQGVVCILLVGMIFCMFYVKKDSIISSGSTVKLSEEELNAQKPEMEVDLLTPNPYSRSEDELKKVKGIVIHYTANPGSTAKDNRDYFENLKTTHATRVSSHFVIGIDGEIIQCIPTWEISYASNNRNKDTISIECCHPDESGEFTKKTYRSMVNLTAWLCKKFELDSDDVIRHYDVTGKNCPKYFVENEEEWNQFKEYVQIAIDEER